MSDESGESTSVLGKPGEPVAEVDPDDLKMFWQIFRQETRKPGTGGPGLDASVGFQGRRVSMPGVNAHAVWYRSGMIWILNRMAHDRLAPWIEDGEVSDLVFRTMAVIPMEWVGQAEREGLPFDVDEFFRRLGESGEARG